MLSKAEIKYINSLQNKKYRKMEHAFLVEGFKNVEELLLSDYKTLRLFSTEPYAKNLSLLGKRSGIKTEIVSEKELASLGTLENNHSALAVASIKDLPANPPVDNEWVIALDGLNDPGNLGTIIRIADWYGIRKIICSQDSVDCYNPKVINATKGSFTRVDVYYVELSEFLANLKETPILAASMEGTSIYTLEKQPPSILLMGNEANGISESVSKIATKSIHVPRIGSAESLNVGVATGIVIDRLLGG